MSRRKPALRIGGGVLNRNTLHQKAVPENGGLGLLGAYADDDEDEVETTNAVQNNLTQAINNLDSKVADFLKEIDELEANEPKQPDTDADEPPQISYGNWQQCIDENTQHPYYWNTETNEVTWVLPEEISKQLEAISQNTVSQTQSNPVVSTSIQDNVANKECEESPTTSQQIEETEVKEDPVKSLDGESQKDDFFDIDVDAELDQALENVSDPVTQPPELDLELEILRRRLLPLSDEEEQDLMTKFESEILRLEEAEEEKRKKGKWKKYDKIILEKKKEINLEKTKWREERLPFLQNFSTENDKEEKESAIFNEEIEEKRDDEPVSHESDVENTDDPNVEDIDTMLEETLPSKVSTGEFETNSSATQNNDATEDVIDSEDDISALSGTIFDKLKFLGISRRAFTNFHRLLIELETRIADWKEGVLPASYLLKKLQVATQQLKTYEDTATPDGWSCQWDRTAKRYFYVNNKTKTMQWQYPEVHKEAKKENHEVEMENEESKSSKRPITSSEIEIESKKSKTENVIDDGNKASGEKSNVKTEKNENISTEQYNSMYSGYTQTYGSYVSDFSMEGPPPPPPPGEESVPFEIPPPLPSTPAEKPPLPPPPPEDENIEADAEDSEKDDDGIMMEMSDDDDDSKKHDNSRKSETSATSTSTTATMSQQPVLYKPPVPTHYQAPILAGYGMYASQPTIMSYSQQSSTPAIQIQSSSTEQNVSKPEIQSKMSTAKVKTKKTKKVKKPSVATNKSAKGISSLVAQWQKAKHQIEEEDRMLEKDEEEIDQAKLNKQQIEKWKQDQILSGKALNNANFEPVPDDWRTRILKKKGKNTS